MSDSPKQKKAPYIVTVVALKFIPGDSGINVVRYLTSALLVCTSTEEAVQRGEAIIQEKCPDSQGWVYHSCTASELPREMLLAFAQQPYNEEDGNNGDDEWSEFIG